MAKYLDKTGLQTLWGKVKENSSNAVKTVTDKIGQANGIAELGADSKLKAEQLPTLKTVNGESIVGSGNIAIDLNIYQIVEVLPAVAEANPNKIYLVLSETSGEQNLYTEYAKINNSWEKLGEYKAEVDLEPYLKKEDIATEVAKANFVTFNDTASDNKSGVITSNLYKRLIGEKVNNVLISTLDTGDFVIKVEQLSKGNGYTSDVSSTYTLPIVTDSNKAGLMSSTQYSKLNAIADEATKDEAITSEELDEILV